jgi:hypothetical protein
MKATYFFLLYLVLPAVKLNAQITNPNNIPMPVDCWGLNLSDFGASPNIYKHYSCFVLPKSNTIDFNGQREVELIAGKEIHLKPGFSVSALTGNGNFHAAIQKEEVGVAVFAPQTNVGEVKKCEMLELGLNFPDEITDQIQNYFSNIPHDAINPFDPDQINIEAYFIHYNVTDLHYYEQYLIDPADANTAYIRQAFGFYYEEFHTDYSTYADGDWIQDTTSFNFRIRFAPNRTGIWRTEIKIFINGTLEYVLKPIYFNCTPSDCPGFIAGGETTSDKRHFVFENGDAFFGIGQNIPFPTLPNAIMPPNYGVTRSEPPKSYELRNSYIEDLAENEGNFIRIFMTEWADAIEWENLGNYKKAMPFAWETDNMFKLCEKEGVYLLWCHSIQVPFLDNNPYGSGNLAWPGNPYNLELGLSGPRDFFTDPTAKKYYKQRLRYMMARWGYSPSIAGMELMNEINQIIHIPEPYHTDLSLRTDVGYWFNEMKNYIQDVLAYNFNVGSSFTAEIGYADDPPANYPYDLVMYYSDFVDYHNYSMERNRNLGSRWKILNNDLYDLIKKPVIIGEVDMEHEILYQCSELEFHNDIWANAMMGGFGIGLKWHNWMDRYNQDFSVNYIYMREFFDTYIDFKNIDWEPKRWPGVPNSWSNWIFNPSLEAPYSTLRDNYFEVLYMTGDGDHINDKRAFGWVHNRSSYWYNLKGACEDAIITISTSNSDPDDDIIRPGDDDPNNNIIINSGNNTKKYRKIRMFHMSNYQTFDIRWFNPLTGTEYLSTQETHGSGDFIVTIPNNVNFTENKDLVFLMYPNNSSFYTPGLNSQASEIFVIDENYENDDTIKLNKIEGEPEFSMFVYPNPTNQIINIDCSEAILSIEIYNIMGGNISSKIVNSSSTTVDMTDYSKSVYVFKILCKSKMYIVRIVYQ